MRRPSEAQPQNALPRVAIYSRYSSDMQQEISTARQIRTCQAFAESQGWGAVPAPAVYSDEKTPGSTTDRDRYRDLLREIAGSNGRPPFDIIVIEDWSRLTRDMAEATRLIKLCAIYDVRLIGVNDGVDTARKGTKLLTYMKAAMAEGYLDELKDRIRGGLKERFLRGYHPGGSCYGFDTEDVPDPAGGTDRRGELRILGRKIVFNPAEAGVVKRIFRDAAGGLTPREIAATLTREQVPKPCAKYRVETLNGAARQHSPWNVTTVRRLLANPRYAGHWTWNRTMNTQDPETTRRGHRAKPATEVVTQERPELALVDAATWAKVQAHADQRRRDVLRDPVTGKVTGKVQGCAPTGAGSGNPWHGLLVCAECGGPFNVLLTKADADGRPRRWVGCVRHQRCKDGCSNAGIVRLDRVDGALTDALADYFSDTQLTARRFKRFLEETNKATRQQAKADTADLRTRDDHRAKIERIKAIILSGGAGPTTAGMLKDQETALAEAEKRLADRAALRDAKPAMKPPTEILTALKVEAYHDRRAAYRQLVSRVELRSHRPAGLRRQGATWAATITPRPEAGIQGLPTALIASGRSASP